MEPLALCGGGDGRFAYYAVARLTRDHLRYDRRAVRAVNERDFAFRGNGFGGIFRHDVLHARLVQHGFEEGIGHAALTYRRHYLAFKLRQVRDRGRVGHAHHIEIAVRHRRHDLDVAALVEQLCRHVCGHDRYVSLRRARSYLARRDHFRAHAHALGIIKGRSRQPRNRQSGRAVGSHDDVFALAHLAAGHDPRDACRYQRDREKRK